MTHSGLKRAAPKGTNWWRCPDCLKEGPLRMLMTVDCTAERKQPRDEALHQMVEGVGKYAPDAEA